MKQIDIAIMGGDDRCNFLAKFLSDFGANIYTYAQEKGRFLFEKYESSCDVYIFPVFSDFEYLNTSLSNEKILIEDVLSYIPKHALILGGNVTSPILEKFEKHGLKIEDYLKREELVVLNALATAEGVLNIAMSNLLTTIHDGEFLVLGGGRIAKILASKLRNLGGNVKVALRNPIDTAILKTQNLSTQTLVNLDYTHKYDVIFNTIPAMILDEEKLKLLDKNTLIIDLASKPGGVDFCKAKELDLNAIHALAIPGKYVPKTAGKYIFNTVLNILNERGYLDD